MKYPKLWNGPSPVGEALVRALQRTGGSPFQTSLTADGITAGTMNKLSEVKQGKEVVESGYAFKQGNGDWPYEGEVPLGNTGFSRLKKLPYIRAVKADEASRKYSYTPVANDKYGEGCWHGTRADRVLSWRAGTTYYTATVSTMLNGALSAARASGLCQIGTQGVLYYKGRELLNLADYSAMDGLVPLTEYVVSGAAMDRRYIYIAAATNTLGSTGATSTTTATTLYRVFFVRIPYTKRISDGWVIASKRIETLGRFDSAWYEAQLAAAKASAIAQYGAASGGAMVQYNLTSPFGEINVSGQHQIVPLSDWRFNQSATKAICTFISAEVGNTTPAHHLIEFDVNAGLSIPFPKFELYGSMQWPNGDGLRVPGGLEVFDNAYSYVQNVYGTDLGELGFDRTTSVNWLPHDAPSMRMTMLADYADDVLCAFEMKVTNYRDVGGSFFAVARPTRDDPFSITDNANIDQEWEERLFFTVGGEDQMSAQWLYARNRDHHERAAGTTTMLARESTVIHPLCVLGADPKSGTMVWLDVQTIQLFRETYETIDIAVKNPGFPVEYVPYVIVPHEIHVTVRMRAIVEGVEQAPLNLFRDTYATLSPDAQMLPTESGPFASSSTTISAQGFYVMAHGKHFFEGVLDLVANTFDASHAGSSGASFFGQYLFSTSNDYAGFDAKIAKLGQLTIYGFEIKPWSQTEMSNYQLGTPVRTVLNGDPISWLEKLNLTDLVPVPAGAWLERISIF